MPTSVAIWGVAPPETVPTVCRVGSRFPFHASTAASFCACADAAFDALRCLSMPSYAHHVTARTSTPTMKAANARTQPRCANGFFTATGARRGARAACFVFVLPLPLIAIGTAF